MAKKAAKKKSTVKKTAGKGKAVKKTASTRGDPESRREAEEQLRRLTQPSPWGKRIFLMLAGCLVIVVTILITLLIIEARKNWRSGATPSTDGTSETKTPVLTAPTEPTAGTTPSTTPPTSNTTPPTTESPWKEVTDFKSPEFNSREEAEKWRREHNPLTPAKEEPKKR